MFYGEYPTSVDDKGRVVIPARMREAVRVAEGAVGFMLTLGDDDCIVIHTPNRWRQLEARVNAVQQNTERARRRRHLLFSMAAEATCDAQGRMRIPQNLLSAAGISREAVVVGVSTHMELWGRSQWETYKDKMLQERGRDAEAYPEPPSEPTTCGGKAGQ